VINKQIINYAIKINRKETKRAGSGRGEKESDYYKNNNNKLGNKNK
jgi:hypothetical protein